jgi:hypothetical protein
MFQEAILIILSILGCILTVLFTFVVLTFIGLRKEIAQFNEDYLHTLKQQERLVAERAALQPLSLSPLTKEWIRDFLASYGSEVMAIVEAESYSDLAPLTEDAAVDLAAQILLRKDVVVHDHLVDACESAQVAIMRGKHNLTEEMLTSLDKIQNALELAKGDTDG